MKRRRHITQITAEFDDQAPISHQWKCEKCGQPFRSRHKGYVWCLDCRDELGAKAIKPSGQNAYEFITASVNRRMLYYEFMERGCEELTGEERRLHTHSPQGRG